MKRSDVITTGNIRPGDVIVGFASSGKATYEKEYNGGMGSNGLTSARHDVFSKAVASKYPETFDPALDSKVVYSGSKSLTDLVEVKYKDLDGKMVSEKVTAGKLVLSPTRTYAPLIKKILSERRKDIHAIIHCSGGGQTKVNHFAKKLHIVKDNLFELPPLFKMIQSESGTDWKEMYQVFNMGHRMEIYCPQEAASSLIQIAGEFNIEAKIIGRCEASESTQVTIRSEYGEFTY
jgi:phosphoribosylformylglycinamidine cyclo-ligase